VAVEVRNCRVSVTVGVTVSEGVCVTVGCIVDSSVWVADGCAGETSLWVAVVEGVDAVLVAVDVTVDGCVGGIDVFVGWEGGRVVGDGGFGVSVTGRGVGVRVGTVP
jgi:hypothetical protein